MKRTKRARVVDLAAVERVRGELRALVAAHPRLVSPEAQRRLATFLRSEGADDAEPETDETTMAEDKLTEIFSMRVHTDDLARLEALEGRLPIKRQDIARAAMRLGLAALERDPAALLSPEATRREAPKGKAKR